MTLIGRIGRGRRTEQVSSFSWFCFTLLRCSSPDIQAVHPPACLASNLHMCQSVVTMFIHLESSATPFSHGCITLGAGRCFGKAGGLQSLCPGLCSGRGDQLEEYRFSFRGFGDVNLYRIRDSGFMDSPTSCGNKTTLAGYG